MTQEQKITRGSIVIFILSIVLLVCLCVTATLAYFAGSQTSDMTLILGGPVRVSMIDRNFQEQGHGNLVMRIKTDRTELLPGMGIDMQTIAHITSSHNYSTSALLRAKLDITVSNLSAEDEKEVETIIRNSMASCLNYRETGVKDGWVLFDDGLFYYCSKDKAIGDGGAEYIVMATIETSDEGSNITFINGTFQFPTKYYTNQYSHAEITFTLTFEAIQAHFQNDEGKDIPNTIFNVKPILDSVDWSAHNN